MYQLLAIVPPDGSRRLPLQRHSRILNRHFRSLNGLAFNDLATGHLLRSKTLHTKNRFWERLFWCVQAVAQYSREIWLTTPADHSGVEGPQ